MSITDELRLFAADPYTGWVPTEKQQTDLRAIADRIDAEHESACAEAYSRGYDEGFASADDWLGDHEDAMAEHGWVRLPKDADGECIQPSDIPYLTKVNDGKRLAFCPLLELRQDGTWMLAGWTPDRYRILKPTVDDVLREFALAVCKDDALTIREGVVEEYAAKLRLAGDGEEQ